MVNEEPMKSSVVGSTPMRGFTNAPKEEGNNDPIGKEEGQGDQQQLHHKHKISVLLKSKAADITLALYWRRRSCQIAACKVSS